MKANQPNKPAALYRRNPYLDGLLAVIDFALAFVLFRSALDSGSLLQYAVSLLAAVLGIRSAITVMRGVRITHE